MTSYCFGSHNVLDISSICLIARCHFNLSPWFRGNLWLPVLLYSQEHNNTVAYLIKQTMTRSSALIQDRKGKCTWSLKSRTDGTCAPPLAKDNLPVSDSWLKRNKRKRTIKYNILYQAIFYYLTITLLSILFWQIRERLMVGVETVKIKDRHTLFQMSDLVVNILSQEKEVNHNMKVYTDTITLLNLLRRDLQFCFVLFLYF